MAAMYLILFIFIALNVTIMSSHGYQIVKVAGNCNSFLSAPDLIENMQTSRGFSWYQMELANLSNIGFGSLKEYLLSLGPEEIVIDTGSGNAVARLEFQQSRGVLQGPRIVAIEKLQPEWVSRLSQQQENVLGSGVEFPQLSFIAKMSIEDVPEELISKLSGASAVFDVHAAFSYIFNIHDAATFAGRVLKPGGFWFISYIQHLLFSSYNEELLTLKEYSKEGDSFGAPVVRWLTEFGSFELVASEENATAFNPTQFSPALILKRTIKPLKLTPLTRVSHTQRFEYSGPEQRVFSIK